VLVPTIADWCAIDVLKDDGRIARLAAFHADPAKIALAHAIEERYPGDRNAAHGVPNVLRTGNTEWMADIPDTLLAAAAKDDEHLQLIRSLGLRSYIAVPLQARGRMLGVLSIVFAESGRNYAIDDVRYVEELAKRASLSIDNAKLYTQQVEAREALEHQSRHALLVGDVGTALTRSKTLRDTLQRCAEAMVKHLGVACARIWTVGSQQELLELQASAGIYIHLDGPQAKIPRGHLTIGKIAASGAPYVTNVLHDEPQTNPEWADGLSSFAGYPLSVEERVVGVVALYARTPLSDHALAGITSVADAIAVGVERNRAEQTARVERDTLEVVNEVGQALAAVLDLETLVQAVTDYATRLSGAAFGAFFYNVVGPSGESYTLYTISGVPREAFSKFPMPRNTQVFGPTFDGQGIVRVDDIRKDPRYGHNSPYYGMPTGHLPVTSYLAVPVVSRSGSVIGGLFFGHPHAAMFTERHEAVVAGVAAQAATAMDNARLFKEAQYLISRLDQSNKELDQFAYVASHDLKAPLRGIASVSQWLEEDLGDAVTKTAKEHFALLRNRVERMEGLINGILDYSRAGKVKTKIEQLAVGELLQEVIEMVSPDTEVRVNARCRELRLVTERIPLQQVFMNLISNALKHAKHAQLSIQVDASDAGEFVQFSVTDNGPGIAPRFHERIWGIFQTLEPRDAVEGTGIGLSVVKKLVETKGGHVDLKSSEGEGATFVFTWPKIEKMELNV
jgi:signal transduction histidine kinase